MTHLLWSVQDVILRLVHFLHAKDAVHLLQTCSVLYSVHEQPAFWYSLLDYVLAPRLLPSPPYTSPDHTLPELKALVQRAFRADKAWCASTAPLISCEAHPLEPGDYIDAVLPGTDLLLVHNRKEEKLRLFDCRSGTRSAEWIQLGKRITRRSAVSYCDGFFRVAYAESLREWHDEEHTQQRNHVLYIRFVPQIDAFRTAELIAKTTTRRIDTLFVNERGFGCISREGVLACDERSGDLIWGDLDLPEDSLAASRVVNDRVCLITYQIDDEPRTPQNSMCYLSPSLSSPDHMHNNSKAVDEKVFPTLEIVPITNWNEPASEDWDIWFHTAQSAMDGPVGMNFELVERQDDRSLVRITAWTFELPRDCSPDEPSSAQPRASVNHIELPDINMFFDNDKYAYDIDPRDFEPRVAGDGTMLAFPVQPNADELRRVIFEHARNAPADPAAYGLAKAVRIEPEIYEIKEVRAGSNWGKLKLVRFVPHGPAHVCDLEIPSDLAEDRYADVLLLDATRGKVYVQQRVWDDPGIMAPQLWCLNYT